MKKRILASFMLLTLLISIFTFNLATATQTDGLVGNEKNESETSSPDGNDNLENPDGDNTDNPDGDSKDNTENPDEEETITAKAENIPLTMDKNTILTANLQGSSTLENPTLKYIIVEQPTNGTLVHSDETSADFTYTPNLDYVGSDTFTYKVNDGSSDSNIATVTITISEVTGDIIPFYYIDMQNHWANYSASQLAAKGVIIGEEIGQRYYFYPDREMTRADFILFLLAVTESNEDAQASTPDVTFADAKDTPDWLIEAAKLAYSKGFIKGSADGNLVYLKPYSILTKKEAAVMINNVLKLTDSAEDLKYKDASSIPTWAVQSIKNLSAYKIIQGNTENEFRPNKTLTRAEAIELTYKLVKQLEANSMEDIK